MNLLSLFVQYKYPAIFVMSIVEGPVTMTATGFLLKLGYFSWIAALGTLLIGDLIGDVFWYTIGAVGGQRFLSIVGPFFGIQPSMVTRLVTQFQSHQQKIIFFSKITMGFGFAIGTLCVAGMSHVPLKKFLFFNALGGILWTSFLLVLGYSFGAVFQQIEEGFRVASFVGFFLFLMLVLHRARIYFRSRFDHV